MIEKNRITTERERFRLEVEQGKYISKVEAREWVLTNIGAIFRELDKSFKHELPPRAEGMSAGAIAKLNGQRLATLRAQLAEVFA